MQYKSTSKRLLTRVLSVYFVITFVITCFHILSEYNNTKHSLKNELTNQHNTISASLTRSLWEFNYQQIDAIAEGLMTIPAISGVIIRDDAGRVIRQLGLVQPLSSLPNEPINPVQLDATNGVFGQYNPLTFEFAGQSTLVGDIALFSSRRVIVESLKVSILFLVGNAFIKSTFLILLFSLAFHRHLTRPMQELTLQLESFQPDRLGESKIKLSQTKNTEFGILEAAYNDLIDRIQQHQKSLGLTKEMLEHANRRLDNQNDLLEQEVAQKTSGMSKLMLDIEERNLALEQRQYELEREVQQRKLTEAALKRTNERLTRSIETISKTQQHLVKTEKMASLGELVSVIAHDVNTPIGIGVTTTSFLADRVEALAISMEDKSLTQSQLNRFIADARESVQLLENNLHRAAELMVSFKEVAISQSAEANRTVILGHYINSIIRSLQPRLKGKNIQIDVSCCDSLQVRLQAGALAQILTNMILNSVIHGFEGATAGTISIRVSHEQTEQGQNHLFFHYEDNGLGLSKGQLEHLFDPFYTTKADRGGSGLGAHIIYTLIHDTMGGTISASSHAGSGLAYDFSFPVTLVENKATDTVQQKG
ncbi:ATP-binding protein [Aliidiomarina taiwanensis]|uniref:histidine kinase n=1 Tax=Aliidiomarina taiwanensis TaxID=946228 RepID=A0A432X1G3_9GAMM|nr:ATP-binding protein [Aliidiomarina taiwanensis]RUO40123.1 ATP-binding protein [Aliidiomarina taiwanensis]